MHVAVREAGLPVVLRPTMPRLEFRTTLPAQWLFQALENLSVEPNLIGTAACRRRIRQAAFTGH